MKNLSEKEVLNIIFGVEDHKSFVLTPSNKTIEAIDAHQGKVISTMEEIINNYKIGLLSRDEATSQMLDASLYVKHVKHSALKYAEISEEFYNGYLYAKQMI